MHPRSCALGPFALFCCALQLCRVARFDDVPPQTAQMRAVEAERGGAAARTASSGGPTAPRPEQVALAAQQALQQEQAAVCSLFVVLSKCWLTDRYALDASTDCADAKTAG